MYQRFILSDKVYDINKTSSIYRGGGGGGGNIEDAASLDIFISEKKKTSSTYFRRTNISFLSVKIS